MTGERFVSIVLPTYNRGYCIGRTIDSVIAQTYTNWELIITDDCSTDDTTAVARSYCEKDSRIRYNRNRENVGLPRNRNAGISLAKGSLICFIEDDVVMEPDCLGMLVKAYEDLKAQGRNIGGIGPRSIEPKKKGRLLAMERNMGSRQREKMKVPSLIGKWTGLPYQNFGMDSGTVVETMLVPSWSLFDKKSLEAVGGYEAAAYNRFNYSHEETDFFSRLRRGGYPLYFQPKAVAHHMHEYRGGTRTSPVKYYYYFLGAHITFLIRNYGWKAFFMVPACLLFIAYGVVISVPALLSGKS